MAGIFNQRWSVKTAAASANSYTFKSSTSAVFGLGGGTTSSIATTGAKLIVVGIWWNRAGGASAANLTDSKGNTWTKLTEQDNINIGTVLYYCISPAVGPGHTFSTTSNFVGIGVLAVTDTGTPFFDQESGANQNASGNLQPGSITPSVNNCLVVTAFGSFNGITSGGPAIPTGYTQVARNTTSTAEAGGMGYKIQTTASAENPTWNDSGSSETAVLATFKP